MRGMIGKFVLQTRYDREKGRSKYRSFFAYEIVAVIDRKKVLGKMIWSVSFIEETDDEPNEIHCTSHSGVEPLDELELFPEPEAVRREQYEIGEFFKFYMECPPMDQSLQRMVDCHRTNANRVDVTLSRDEFGLDLELVGRWVNGVSTMAKVQAAEN